MTVIWNVIETFWELRLSNYIIPATLSNTNGIILAVAYSDTVYLLKNLDTLHTSPLYAAFHLKKIWTQVFKTVYVLGQY